MIEFQNVVKHYTIGETHFTALNGVSIAIDEGELVAIVGASGSGKTTMMNIMGLLDKPSQGSYRLLGEDSKHLTSDQQAEYRNRLIGFVFQSFLLLPRLTALQNVGLPLMYSQVPKAEIQQRSRAILQEVGVGDHLRHHPYELSGGQQQRVAIARALVGNPKLILADEPTGALDSKTSDVVMNLLIEANKKRGVTVVVITHDPQVASLCDRKIKVHDGLIVND